ncbi:MAG: transposase domain-containing protein [Waltera sp.]
MYSLVETAKANGLRVYEYLEYVLTELAAHQDDASRDFLADLILWSKAAQKNAAA